MAFSRVLVATLRAAAVVSAQGRGGGGGGGGGGGADSGGGGGGGGYKIPTLFEVLSGKLDLDSKVQQPAVKDIFADVNQKATPLITELFTLRQRMLAAEVANRPEIQKAAVDEYAVSDAKMVALEVEAFRQVYAQLKPDQKKKASEGFVIMAGMYLPRMVAPSGRRPGGGSGAPQGGGGGR